MSPKKKSRTSVGGNAPVPAGNASASPLSIHAVSPVLMKVRDVVNDIYNLRHETEATSKPDKHMGWPVLWGGSFKDICNRFWTDPAKGIIKVLDLCKACGVVPDTDTPDELGYKFMHIDDPFAPAGDGANLTYNLSILAFSFADDSFIQGTSVVSAIVACGLLRIAAFRRIKIMGRPFKGPL